MTGVSLGLRSGSHGSLQQQPHGGAVLPVQSPAVVPRRPARLFSGSREKERILPRICKFVGRRKLSMLLLLMTSVAVLSFTSIVSKEVVVSHCNFAVNLLEDQLTEEDVLEGPNNRMDSTRQVWEVVDPGRPSMNSSSPFLADKNKSDATLGSNQEFASLNNSSPPVILAKNNKVDIISESNQELSSDNINQISVPIIPPILHPCENFPPPSPPADKRHTGPRPCPVCYVPVEQALLSMPRSPSRSPVLEKLSYFSEDNFIFDESNEGSTFGGHPSLLQRNEYFDIKESMTVHCGFANGMKPGQGTGFDIDENFLSEMEECHDVVVASAIFGNYDVIQQPKNVSEYAKKNACFYMFIDEETEAYMKNSSALDETQRIGLWRVVVVRNLPYADSRRNGKVPKLLLHRLFPNVRFSLWIDGKLELVVDPYQVLERFLWRRKHTFAISRHYKRFDVFVEAEANKAAGKYDNASIDYQIEFYRKEGLTPYSPSKLPITSDVPEGCVIVKEHIPITNLFTCLWFNEVDRFTSRDQISFSTARDKIMSQVNWTINMFEDCERRNFVVQAYHRDLLEQRKALAEKLKALAATRPPPAAAAVTKGRFMIARPPPSRKLLPAKVPRKERRTRRHHPRAAIGL